ncbi:MAG: response regulator, partial [Candidatus Omnitrophica bacterium]|nr:response regulator [Candidatus Omnitrophota bacterium]
FAKNVMRQYTFVNEAAVRMIGVRADEIIGRTAEELFGKAEALLVREVDERSLGGQTANDVRKLMIKGKERFLHTVQNPVLDSRGKVAGIVGVVRDVTEAQRAQRELRASEERFRGLFRSMIEGFALHEILCDHEGRPVNYRIVDVNPSFERHTGLKRSVCVGKTATEVYGTDEPPFWEIYERVARTGEPHVFETYFKPLERHFMISTFSPNPGYFATVFEDISDRKKAEAALLAAKEKAEQLSSAKTEFLMNVSHDIRTPINVISGFTEFLMKTPLEDEQLQFCELMKRKTSDLIRLVEDMIDIAALEKGKVRLHSSPFDVRELIDDLRETLEIQVAGKEIRCGFEIGEKVPPRLIGDALRLKQILENLCGNAAKYTDKGAIDLTVDAGEPSDPGRCRQIRFTVKDTGSGISADKLPQIFEPYSRFVESGADKHKEGVGMGLHIVETLVREMGGEVLVSSEVGKGSTFSFAVPLREAAAPDRGPGAGPAEEDLRSAGLGGIRILVAEDDETNRFITARLLKDEDCAVTFVHDGEGALEELKKSRYDLILMDLRMPRMDGFEAAREIRAGIDANIPILALTAHVGEWVEKDCLDAGMNGYLAKPVTAEQLKQMILRHVAARGGLA